MTEITARLSTALADRYKIERRLGEGGMATVYLAEDLKHKRKVAVKVLRPELAAVLGAERFVQEITTTANLQHPHILPLFDSGEADSFLYYVMPFVDGETLRDKMNRERQLGLDEAVKIATEVADALDYAHRHDVIHRDIKPENILLHDGRPMVADFGIALAVKEAGGNRLTETGLSLGTPQYMSPEQATGELMPDSRSDVYSLGAVLYEMLAGEPPVTGPTAQATIAKLLTERPVRLRVVRHGVPEFVEAAVARALDKTPADRFGEAGQFAAALHGSPVTTPAPQIARRWLFAAFAGVLLLVSGTVALIRGRAPEDAPFVLGRSQQLTAADGLEIQPSLSPDGNLVAYAAGNAARMRIHIRPVGGGRTITVSDDTTAVEHQPRWSPDGAGLLFLSRGGVSVSSALGGSSRSIVPPATPGIAAAAWSADGLEIVFVRHDSLLVVPVAGGAERLVATAPNLHSCDWSPDGRWIACVQLNDESVRPGTTFGNLAPSAIVLFPATGGPGVRVVDPQAFNQSPVWSPDTRWLYFLSSRDGPRDIYAVIIESSGQPRGVPVRVTTGLGASSFALNADGTRLSYTLYTARSNIWSLPIAAAARPSEATPLSSGSQVIEALRVSADGRWLLYDSDRLGNADAYRMPVGGGEAEQLTSDPADEFAPDLSPDGRWLTYHSWRSGTRDIEVKALEDGTVESVTATPAQESYPLWSPRGDAILFYDQSRPFSVMITRRDAGGQWTSPEVIARPGQGPEWSPDGQVIAYVGSETDALRGPVMVVPVDGGPPRRVLASSDSLLVEGVLWSPDGRTLYLKTHDSDGRAEFWTVGVEGGVPRLLVRLNPDQESARRDFAVDETRLYFTLEHRQSDVHIAELLSR